MIILLIPFLVLLSQEDEYKQARYEMVKHQMANRNINDKSVLDAFRAVKRHEFVPEKFIDNAYEDRPLPIGYGQTISQPYMVAYMTEIIKPDENHKVLEIGTGSGYQAAILAKIVKEVYTIEIIEELENEAGKRLKDLDFENVSVKNADGYYGWQEHAPFDAIVVTAAAEYIPPPLIKQLKDGGKMIIPVGSPFFTQRLMLVEKNGEETKTKSVMPVRFVPFTRGNE